MSIARVQQVLTDTSGLEQVSSVTKKRTITLKAVKAGGKIVQAAAKQKAPRRKGIGGGLRQSIGLKPVKGKKGRTLAYCVVGPRHKVVRMVKRGRKTYKHRPSKIAHIVEKGSQPHTLRKGKSGGVVRHPGAKPKPWLAPAFREQKARVGAVVAVTLADETQKVIAKVRLKDAAKKRGK